MVCVFGLWHLSCFLFFQILKSAILCSIDLRKFSAIIALNIFFPFGSLFLYSNYKYVTCSDIISHFLDDLFFGFFFFICFLLEFQFEKILLTSSSSLLLSLAVGYWWVYWWTHPCPTGFLIVCLLLRLFFRVVSGIGQNWAEGIEIFHLFLYMHSLSHCQPE